MKKLLIPLAIAFLMTSCGSSSAPAEQPAEATAATTTSAENESTAEPEYEDISAYDFIIPSSAKCTIINRFETSVLINFSNIQAHIMQLNTTKSVWSSDDKKNAVKNLVVHDIDDFREIENIQIDMNEENINGWTLFSIPDYKGESAVCACRHYNVSNYLIFFSPEINFDDGYEEKSIIESHDEIVDFINSIKNT